MKQGNIESLEKQLARWKSNLEIWKLEEARAGGHPPINIINDIETAEKRIGELEHAIDNMRNGEEEDGFVATYNSLISLFARLDREMHELRSDVEKNHADISALNRAITLTPREHVAQAVFWTALGIALFLWTIFEIRTYYIGNPLQAILITVALVSFAFLVRWLPENER